MSANVPYLDENGLLFLLQQIDSWLEGKVDKVTGKGLSTNDFTTALLTKLNGIAEGATKNTVENTLTSTSTTNALSAAQGKVLNDGKVDKVDGKGLSTNDFTTALLNKLNGIAEGANKTTVENVLTSTSTANALSAAQGKALKDLITQLQDSMGSLGYGDMMKNVYDTDNSGVVDNAEKLGGQLPSYYAAKSTTLAGYGISNAFTKDETNSAIATAVANAGHLKRTIVTSLPAIASADANTIYMLKADDSSSDNKYVEYMAINGAWEKTGDTTVDLTPYQKTEDLVPITNARILELIAQL